MRVLFAHDSAVRKEEEQVVVCATQPAIVIYVTVANASVHIQ